MTAPATYQDPYPGRKGSERVTETCPKCGGGGHLPGVLVDAGRCWSCLGDGTVSVLVSSARSRARRRVQRAAEREQHAATASDTYDAARAELVAAWPPIGEALQADSDADYDAQRIGHAASAAVVNLRDGLDLAEVVADYRWEIGETVRDLRPNRFRGNCAECKDTVDAGAGWVGQKAQDGWVTFCADHKPTDVS